MRFLLFALLVAFAHVATLPLVKSEATDEGSDILLHAELGDATMLQDGNQEGSANDTAPEGPRIGQLDGLNSTIPSNSTLGGAPAEEGGLNIVYLACLIAAVVGAIISAVFFVLSASGVLFKEAKKERSVVDSSLLLK